MSDTVAPAKDNERVFRVFLESLGKGSVGEVKRRMWTSNGVPAVDAGSEGSYPVAVGDFCVRRSNSYPYVCTVAPTANTAATFVAMKV